MRTKYLVVLSFFILSTLLISPLASADRGMIIVGPEEITLEESGQNAIVAWNGDEEVIILSTDAKSSGSTLVLELLPLPSNPKKVEEGSFDSFEKLTKMVNEKVEYAWEEAGQRMLGVEKGVEITFHKKIGAHDVTVVKVNDLDQFVNWVGDFTTEKGFKNVKISPEFRDTVKSYLKRDIKFFVFDVIEASKDEQSVKPLVYRFKTDYLYYPLEITAASDAGRSYSRVNIFLISNERIDKKFVELATGIDHFDYWVRTTGFDHDIYLSKEELKEVSPELEDLFKSKPDPFVMNAFYEGRLDRLSRDLIIHKRSIPLWKQLINLLTIKNRRVDLTIDGVGYYGEHGDHKWNLVAKGVIRNGVIDVNISGKETEVNTNLNYLWDLHAEGTVDDSGYVVGSIRGTAVNHDTDYIDLPFYGYIDRDFIDITVRSDRRFRSEIDRGHASGSINGSWYGQDLQLGVEGKIRPLWP